MGFLKENTDVRQREEEGFRRWFVNSYFDIIIWYDKPQGNLIGFQVCYSRNRNEKAFTWEPGSTSSHFVSSSYQEPGVSASATAILRGYAGGVPEEVITRLVEEAGELDRDLLAFITEKMRIYNATDGSQGAGSYLD